MEHCIIPEHRLVPFIKKVYDLSHPQGLGFIHYTNEPLSDADAVALIQPTGRIAVCMDYVRGRACKMCVFRDYNTGTLHFELPWFDHTRVQEAELLLVLADPKEPTAILGMSVTATYMKQCMTKQERHTKVAIGIELQSLLIQDYDSEVALTDTLIIYAQRLVKEATTL